jgi:DNA-binding IclR family transcriptional regulator
MRPALKCDTVVSFPRSAVIVWRNRNSYLNDPFVSERQSGPAINSALDGGAALAPDAEDRYRAPALDKGLDILEHLAAIEDGQSQAEIAKALARSPNEIYRMLDRLVRRGYVLRDPSDRYALTLKLFALGHQHAPLRRLVSQATPILRRLARAAEQSFHLAVYERGRVVVVAQVDSPGYWGLAIRVGAQVDLLNTGSGHVLLAFQTLRERDHMLTERGLGEAAPVATADLHARLDEVRTRGFEGMESQQTRGVVNLSAPVLGAGNSALAALTCPYLDRVDRTQSATRDAVTDLVCAAARELSLAAGAK